MAQPMRENLEGVAELLATGDLKVPVQGTYELDRARGASGPRDDPHPGQAGNRDRVAAGCRRDGHAFKRAVEAYNRRDVQAVLDELDPEVESHPGLPGLPALLGGEAAVGRGHEGVRKLLGYGYDAFAELHLELSEVRGLGADVLAIGRIYARGRGRGSRPSRRGPT
jgi:hypothetical protein